MSTSKSPSPSSSCSTGCRLGAVRRGADGGRRAGRAPASAIASVAARWAGSQTISSPAVGRDSRWVATTLPAQRTVNSVAVDRAADLDELAEAPRAAPSSGRRQRDERHDVVHPAGLDVVGVEPHPRQRRQERPLDRAAARPVVHRSPATRTGCTRSSSHVPGAPVQLVEIGGDAVELDLGQERLLQLAERPLDLALAFRVPALHDVIVGAVMRGETDRRRVQHEPAALRAARAPPSDPSGSPAGIPPAASKNRAMPSKVCSRSSDVVNHHIRHRDQHKIIPKHHNGVGHPTARPVRQSQKSNWASSPGSVWIGIDAEPATEPGIVPCPWRGRSGAAPSPSGSGKLFRSNSATPGARERRRPGDGGHVRCTVCPCYSDVVSVRWSVLVRVGRAPFQTAQPLVRRLGGGVRRGKEEASARVRRQSDHGLRGRANCLPSTLRSTRSLKKQIMSSTEVA